MVQREKNICPLLLLSEYIVAIHFSTITPHQWIPIDQTWSVINEEIGHSWAGWLEGIRSVAIHWKYYIYIYIQKVYSWEAWHSLNARGTQPWFWPWLSSDCVHVTCDWPCGHIGCRAPCIWPGEQVVGMAKRQAKELWLNMLSQLSSGIFHTAWKITHL